MKIHHFHPVDLSNAPTVVTLGNFDGVHLGHQALIAKARACAQEVSGVSLLHTFRPHPQEVLHPDCVFHRLCTPEQELRLLKDTGLDGVVEMVFNSEFSCLEPEEFVDRFLLHPFQIHTLVIGYDFRFGKNRKGDYRLLKRMSQKHGFQLIELSAVQVDKQTVSSSLIRQLIQEFRFDEVKKYLGRDYTLEGIVTEGDRRGAELGFPTANLVPDVTLALISGVYLTEVLHQGRYYYGLSNVGTRPSFGENNPNRIETWILDFDQNIYGDKLEIRPLHYLRPEYKFSGIVALKAQILEDERQARAILSGL